MIPNEATLLRLYVNADNRWNGQPLYRSVVESARGAHLAGASVFLVDLSYGAHRRIHDVKNEYTSFEIPVEIDIVDGGEQIDLVLRELDQIMLEGLVVIKRPVRVARYASADRAGGWQSEDLSCESRPWIEANWSDSAMKIEGEARRVTVYVGSTDKWNGRNLASAIVTRCRELGIAGATASLGVMGFGRTSRIHRAHLFGLSEDLPERIEIVDQLERINTLIPVLKEMVGGGLIVVEDVHVIRYLHDPKGQESAKQ